MRDALIIDSSITACMTVERALREGKYRPQICLPNKAKDLLQDNSYHVVIIGVYSSDVDCVEIVRFIREMLPDDKAGLPIIALYTCDAEMNAATEDDKIKSLVNCALSKPVDQEKLLQKMFEFVPVL